MAEKLETKLKRAFLSLKRQGKIQNFIKQLDAKKPKLERELIKLEKYMKKEYLDIVMLEKKALRPLFQTFLGTIEEALDKERQEYLLAVLNYQAKEQEIKALIFQRRILQDNLVELNASEKNYKKLKKKFFLQVNLNNPRKAQRLEGIKNKILKLHVQTKEIREAFSAGKKVLPTLQKLKTALDQLEHWGVGDIEMDMSGKGRLSSQPKKRYIDRTKVIAFTAQKKLNKFQMELKDVSKSIKVSFDVEIETINEFLNVFFDNLITDWIVEEKIELALMSVRIINERIVRTEKILEFELEGVRKEIKK